MYLALFVIYTIIAAVAATPIEVKECGVLDSPLATYKLANDILISNLSYGFVCLNIRGNGITLDGNGFLLSSEDGSLLSGTGVQYSGTGATVTNLRVSNLRTGIHANAKFGKVHRNTITRAVNGIDITATHNDIYNNIIKEFISDEATSGIYVYFPAIAPIDSSISITNNIISDIQGDTFALGISVYYATSVLIARNEISNIKALLGDDISIINGDATLVDNILSAPSSNVVEYSTATMVVSGLALLASVLYYHLSYTSSPTPTPSSSSSSISASPVSSSVEKKEEIENDEDDDDEDDSDVEDDEEVIVEERNLSEVNKSEVKKDIIFEKGEKGINYDKDGADELRLRRPTVSFHIGSSPSLT